MLVGDEEGIGCVFQKCFMWIYIKLSIQKEYGVYGNSLLFDHIFSVNQNIFNIKNYFKKL